MFQFPLLFPEKIPYARQQSGVFIIIILQVMYLMFHCIDKLAYCSLALVCVGTLVSQRFLDRLPKLNT